MQFVRIGTVTSFLKKSLTNEIFFFVEWKKWKPTYFLFIRTTAKMQIAWKWDISSILLFKKLFYKYMYLFYNYIAVFQISISHFSKQKKNFSSIICNTKISKC